MNSRAEKYCYNDIEDSKQLSRVEKNQGLYNNIDVSQLSRIKTNSNVKVIEKSSKNIDIEKIKKYIENNEIEKPIKRNIVVKSEVEDKEIKNLFDERRIYDINSVLEKAKENRENYYEDEKYKKLRDTQYDILSKIEMYEEKSDEEREEPNFNTDEKTLIDLINTVTINRKKEELLDELKGTDNTIVTAPIKEEQSDEALSVAINNERKTFQRNIEDINYNNNIENKEKEQQNVDFEMKNLDKSFYTNSMSFSKEDFEGFEELEKNVKKSNNLIKVSIIVLIILVFVSIFIILKYILNII